MQVTGSEKTFKDVTAANYTLTTALAGLASAKGTVRVNSGITVPVPALKVLTTILSFNLWVRQKDIG